MKPGIKRLVIIPARGGSKGIPRKNLRLLDGKPLIYYSIKTALALEHTDVYVSSEDKEILAIASKIGARIIDRPDYLSEDMVTLDRVIFHAVKEIEKTTGNQYSTIITLQPTSPLLSHFSLREAISKIEHNEKLDSIISVVDDRHLCWVEEGTSIIPEYNKRVNRQQLPKKYKETGGFLITRRQNVTELSRLGNKISVFELPKKEAIDIDHFEDWAICNFYLKQKRVALVTSGYKEIGLGHVYNTLAIANSILDHEIIFIVDKKSKKAFETIKSFNYPVVQQGEESLVKTIQLQKPDIIINDILDTSKAYILSLKKLKAPIINFEDLGEGASYADLVINAIYPEKEFIPNHFFGYKYFCLRNEFLLTQQSVQVKEKVDSVLLTFGGIDPNNFTHRILSIIYDYCEANDIRIKVILGLGYEKGESLNAFKNATIIKNVRNISDHMLEADIGFTSAGRTTFEVASLGLPTIVLCQNEREQTHFFASSEYGFINLGRGEHISDDLIKEIFIDLIHNTAKRKRMSSLMLSKELKSGVGRVQKLIRKSINKI